MLFNSFEFLIFFPCVVLAYYLIPRRFRNVWLLFVSCYFYLSWDFLYIFLLLGITLITYLAAWGIEKADRKISQSKKAVYLKKICVAVCLLLNFGLLCRFKYSLFTGGNIVLPVGISFYTFQSFGYVMDVYRGKTAAEKNFLKYALFVSFFPVQTSGPIERSDNLLKQIQTERKFEWENVKTGLSLMLWGYFLKLVMADRIAIFVNAVFEKEMGGVYAILATLLFGIQIYCDFAGYSSLAIGAARVLGFRLLENFDAPYLSKSVSEFWRKWHISLTSWFRDYLYIPLGGNRKGKIRKYINIMIVFLVSGLWHGAGWKYLIWGGLNGAYQVIGDVLKPVKKKITDCLHMNRHSFLYQTLQKILTFLLVDFAWLFFKAESAGSALRIIRKTFTEFDWKVMTDGSLYQLGLSCMEFRFMLLTILALLVVDILHEKRIYMLNLLKERNICIRAFGCAVLLMIVVAFGVYGVNYDVGTFIYFAF